MPVRLLTVCPSARMTRLLTSSQMGKGSRDEVPDEPRGGLGSSGRVTAGVGGGRSWIAGSIPSPRVWAWMTGARPVRAIKEAGAEEACQPASLCSSPSCRPSLTAAPASDGASSASGIVAGCSPEGGGGVGWVLVGSGLVVSAGDPHPGAAPASTIIHAQDDKQQADEDQSLG